MVNTFITRRRKVGKKFFPDYHSSAKDLDIQRLRKQCVEATQILNILQQVNKIIKLEGWKPIGSASLQEQIFSAEKRVEIYVFRIKKYKNVISRYLAGDTRYVILNGEIEKRSKNDLPLSLYKSDRFTLNDDDTVTVWVNKALIRKVEKLGLNYLYPDANKYDLTAGKRCRTRYPLLFSRRDIALPSDTVYSLIGFSRHAITKMWVGYEESLKAYINAHIKLYCSFTKKNGEQCSMDLPTYKLPSFKTIPHPWWIVSTSAIIFSHRASLLRKYPEHYAPIFSDLPSMWRRHGYVWTASFPENEKELIKKLILKKKVLLKDICAPIQ